MNKKSALYTCLAALGLTLWLGTQPAQAFVNITVLPTNQVVLVGASVAFNAQVSLTAGEVVTGYTWKMSANGQAPFTTVAGATTTNCTLPSVQVSDAGSYFVVVTYNSGGSTGLTLPSTAVQLSVIDQAHIVNQPTNGIIRPIGTNYTFSVTAGGTPSPSYQWRFNRANLSNNTHVSGATTAHLTLSNLVTTDSGSYDVVVANTVGATNYSATSQVATLSVLIPVGPGVPLPSTNYVVLSNNAVFTISPTGSAPLSYQWLQDGTNLVNGGRISGATSNILTIAATVTNDESGYSVIITNPVSGPLTSSVTRLVVWVPATFTSPTNFAWRQGLFMSFTNTATGTLPITFGVDSLPRGLSLEPTNGVISGTPLVTGFFSNITLYATNPAMTTTGKLDLTLTTGAPGITSSLFASGKQGNAFNYTIVASNNPTSFSASALPAGLNLDPFTGVISGAPIVSGTFPVTIGAVDPYGSDSQVLTIIISSSLPVITSSRTAFGTEGQTNFSYRIRASNTPTSYGVSDLPVGLMLNPTNGIISGTLGAGGTYTFLISANNAWGTGSTNLVLTVGYTAPSGLAIADVTTAWSKPYLLDFTFSLRDGTNRATSNPLVRPPSELQVVCMESGVPIQSEAPLILQSAASKQLKTHLVLDYTYSMFVVPGAIDAMQAAAELLIDEEPPHALFGIVEFNADYMTPQIVTNRLTSPTNYFITDKTVLSQTIAGIQTNYVQGNYAGSRCWDAIFTALTNFGTFGPANADEQRYIVAMTDGNDESSALNTSTNPIAVLVARAKLYHVAIYCVGFGDNVNTTALETLTTQTGGRYFLAATTADLGAQFQSIFLELGGQYALRWATLKRVAIPAYPANGFQPSFQVIYNGMTASWNTNLVTTNFDATDYAADPIVTNIYLTNFITFPYNPPDWTNDVRVGALHLLADPDLGPQTIRLRADYVPRSVTMLRLMYRPNYPCTASLSSTNAGEILYGWTMTETADTNGLRTLTMTSSAPTNLLTSIPYAAFGNLVRFDFQYPEALTTKQAFSVFTNDNSIYLTMQPAGTRFVLANGTSYVTSYAPAPPHGTPIPWLTSYGFTSPYDEAELIATNGLPVWQAYLAGLNPIDPNSRFAVGTAYVPGQPPQIIFSTVMGRTYRVETATTIDSWSVLRDGIIGIGDNILFIDNRNLSGVNTLFYRVAVY
jgi:hypothetical protein